ncbi:hypothetical protein ACFL54_06625 [Planctomycetota bacterium]
MKKTISIKFILILWSFLVISSFVCTLEHEVVGHGLIAIAFGAEFKCFTVNLYGTSVACVSWHGNDPSLWFYLGGILVNIVTGTAALAAARFVRTKPWLHLFLTIFAIFNLLTACGYLAFGSLFRAGDMLSAFEHMHWTRPYEIATGIIFAILLVALSIWLFRNIILHCAGLADLSTFSRKMLHLVVPTLAVLVPEFIGRAQENSRMGLTMMAGAGVAVALLVLLVAVIKPKPKKQSNPRWYVIWLAPALGIALVFVSIFVTSRGVFISDDGLEETISECSAADQKIIWEIKKLEFSRNPRKVVPKLISYFRDPMDENDMVTILAATAIYTNFGKSAVPYLSIELKKPGDEKKDAVLFALQFIRDDSVIPDIRAYAMRTQNVRLALSAIMILKDFSDFEGLIQLLDHKQRMVRKLSISSLRRNVDPAPDIQDLEPDSTLDDEAAIIRQWQAWWQSSR